MDGNAMLFFDRQRKIDKLISFINESMKDGNDVYLSWEKLPDNIDLDRWHSLHDDDEIAEVKGSYYDGIIVEMPDYSWHRINLFRLFHEANDFHLYEVIWIDDRYYSFNKITQEICVKTCLTMPIDIELKK